MKNALALIIFTLLLSSTAFSQSFRFLPDPTAQLIDTFTVRVGFDFSQDGTPIETDKQNAGAEAVVIVGGWRNSEGKISYQLEPSTLRFNGRESAIDSLPTATAFTMLTKKGLLIGVQRGYTIPSQSCSAPARADVYATRCVTRVGRGINTHFTVCDPITYNTWQYGVCASSTELSIMLMPSYNPNTCNVSSGCESTYPGSQTSGSTIM